MRLKRRILSLVAVSVAVAVVSAGIALAHTDVAETRPGDGEIVDSPPAEVYIRFGQEAVPQPAVIQDGRLEVLDACGTQVDKEDSSVNMQDSSVTVMSGGEVSGRYEVHWYATAADGAQQSGVFDFTVKKGTPCDQVVRVDPKDDIDVGLDVVSVKSRPVKRGSKLQVTTAVKFGCKTLATKADDALQLKIDTNSDRVAEISGKFVCRRGNYELVLEGDDGVTGSLSATRPSNKAIEVKLPRQVLVAHADLFVEATNESDDCTGDKVCIDTAPDLGWVRIF